MHFPVTSSHKRRPHSHTADGREEVFEKMFATLQMAEHLGGTFLTSAVGEAIVSCSTLCALTADDVLPAGALSSSWIAGRARRPRSVTVAGQSSIVVGRCQSAGGLSAEL